MACAFSQNSPGRTIFPPDLRSTHFSVKQDAL